MAESEFAKQKRERDFQTRVLAALEKPKTSRLFVILNSGFFLWILTASVLTIGGSYVANRQNCIREANTLTERYRRLSIELQSRVSQESILIETAATIADLRAIENSRAGNVYAELKDVVTRELKAELNFAGDKIRYVPMPTEAPLPNIVQSIDYSHISPEFITHYEQIIADPSELFRTIKNFFREQNLFDVYANAVSETRYFRPYCNVGNLLDYALGEQTEIVESLPFPFSRSDIKTIGGNLPMFARYTHARAALDAYKDFSNTLTKDLENSKSLK